MCACSEQGRRSQLLCKPASSLMWYHSALHRLTSLTKTKIMRHDENRCASTVADGKWQKQHHCALTGVFATMPRASSRDGP